MHGSKNCINRIKLNFGIMQFNFESYAVCAVQIALQFGGQTAQNQNTFLCSYILSMQFMQGFFKTTHAYTKDVETGSPSRWQ